MSITETIGQLQKAAQSRHHDEQIRALKKLILLDPQKQGYYLELCTVLAKTGEITEFRLYKNVLQNVLSKKIKNILDKINYYSNQESQESESLSESDAVKDSLKWRKVQNIEQFLRGTIQYHSFPRTVHIETQTVCNADCVFCPYGKLERKGTKMPSELIEKIIDDLSASNVPFTILPYKVSDPLLDSRLYDICDMIKKKIPLAKVGLITNGHALTPRNIDKLWNTSNISYLSISANCSDPTEYYNLMKVSQKPLVRALENLRAKSETTPPPFPIKLTRVPDGTQRDSEFVEWCRTNYASFARPTLTILNDWIGQVETVERNVPDLPCNRWFDLSITATGDVAFCCMDGECAWPIGNAEKENVVDIYNSEHYKKFRSTFFSRRETSNPCQGCNYL